jgi:hypothetical protein
MGERDKARDRPSRAGGGGPDDTIRCGGERVRSGPRAERGRLPAGETRQNFARSAVGSSWAVRRVGAAWEGAESCVFQRSAVPVSGRLPRGVNMAGLEVRDERGGESRGRRGCDGCYDGERPIQRVARGSASDPSHAQWSSTSSGCQSIGARVSQGVGRQRRHPVGPVPSSGGGRPRRGGRGGGPSVSRRRRTIRASSATSGSGCGWSREPVR